MKSWLTFFKTFKPAVPPLKDYWVTVCVAFSEPLKIVGDLDDGDDAPSIAAGYYRNLGIRCHEHDLKELLGTFVDDGSILWEESEWESIDINNLKAAIIKRIEPVKAEGIWYKSGRVMFPAFEGKV